MVAEEIRKLAERTAAATREIGTIVEAIQADTRDSIRALSEEHADMQRESQRVHQTGSSLERISEVAEQSARLVEGISHSTNDQVLTTRELVRAMQRVSSVASQTQERTTEARAFIKALRKSCDPWQRPAGASLAPTAARPARGSLGQQSCLLRRGRCPSTVAPADPVISRPFLGQARSKARTSRERAFAMKPPSTASALADPLEMLAQDWQAVSMAQSTPQVPAADLEAFRERLNALAEDAEAVTAEPRGRHCAGSLF